MHLVIMSGIYIVFALSYDIVVGYLGMLSLAHPAYYGVGAYTSVLLMMRLDVPFPVAFALAGLWRRWWRWSWAIPPSGSPTTRSPS